MFELIIGSTHQSICYILRTQSDSTSPMTLSTHRKQRTVMLTIQMIDNMFELIGCYRTHQSTCYIIRSQSDSAWAMTPAWHMTLSMHPKQRTIMHNTIASIFQLMIGITMNARCTTSFLLRVSRHHSRHQACHCPLRRKHPYQYHVVLYEFTSISFFNIVTHSK